MALFENNKKLILVSLLISCIGCLFFVTHGYSEHASYLNSFEVMRLAFTLSISFAILFFIFSWLTKNTLAAAFVTLFISCWYLFYAPIYSFYCSLINLKGDSFFMMHKFFIVILILSSFLMLILLRRTTIPDKFVKFVLTLAALFLIVDAVATFMQIRNKKELLNDKITLKGTPKTNANIYLIVYDEYPGLQSQLDSFGYDNIMLKQYFKKGDYKYIHSKSNYNLTNFSMASIFNMEYQSYALDNEYAKHEDFDNSGFAVKNNIVCRYLHQHHYTIKNHGVFDIEGYPKTSAYSPFINQNNLLLTHKILHNKLYHDQYWNVYSWFPEWVVKDRKQAFMKQVNTFDNFSVTPDSKHFFYYHFNIPHEPIMADSNGKLYSNDTLMEEHDLNRNMFLQFTKYATKLLIKNCETILHADPNAIVIILSDHGYKYYFNNEETPCDYRFDNVMAIRAPGYKIPDTMTNINCFRWLFNTHFGESLHFLPDSTIFIKLRNTRNPNDKH